MVGLACLNNRLTQPSPKKVCQLPKTRSSTHHCACPLLVFKCHSSSLRQLAQLPREVMRDPPLEGSLHQQQCSLRVRTKHSVASQRATDSCRWPLQHIPTGWGQFADPSPTNHPNLLAHPLAHDAKDLALDFIVGCHLCYLRDRPELLRCPHPSLKDDVWIDGTEGAHLLGRQHQPRL